MNPDFVARTVSLVLLTVGLIGWTSSVAAQPQPDPRLVEAARLAERAEALLDADRTDELLPLAERVYSLRFAATPPGHRERARAEYLMAQVRHVRNELQLAEKHYQRALELALQSDGSKSVLRGNILNDYGLLYVLIKTRTDARPLLEEAIQILENASPRDDFQIASVLNNAGLNDLKLNDKQRAEERLRRSYEILHAIRRTDSVEMVNITNNLGLLHSTKNQYCKAIKYYEEALTIIHKLHGRDSSIGATMLANLGLAQWETGDTDEGLANLEQALQIRERVFGPEHQTVAATLNNMAVLYLKEGNAERAYRLHLRARKIIADTRGTKNTAYAVNVLHIADALKSLNKHTEADMHYKQSIALLNELIPGHELGINAILNYANNLKFIGKSKEAEVLLQDALGQLRAGNAPSQTLIAALLWNLATFQMARGNYRDALAQLQEALELEEAVHGPDFFELSGTLQTLATAQARLGQGKEAAQSLWRSLRLIEGLIRSVRLRTSSRDLDLTLKATHALQNVVFTLLAEDPLDPRLLELSWSTTLLLKGRSLDEIVGRAALKERAATDPEVGRLVSELRAIEDALSALVSKPSVDGADAAQLAKLRQCHDELEAALILSLRPWQIAAPTRDVAEIRRKLLNRLPQDVILFEVVQYAPIPKRLELGAMQLGPLRYVGLTLRRDGTATATDLGDASAMNTAVSELRAGLAHKDGNPEAAERKLYAKLISPLSHVLGPYKRWYYAPDGLLAVAPITLARSSQGLVIDKREVTVLTSGRDLLRPPQPPQSQNILIFANPLSRDARFPSLKHAELEAAAIRSLYPEATLFQGERATSTAFLKAQSPAVLHVAAHGFTGGGQQPLDAARGFTLLPDAPTLKEATELGQKLLSSGLILAAPPPTALGEAQPPTSAMPTQNGGFVTALQLAGMNLRGTQMVVLSSCYSGLGDPVRTQGIYGLRRAVFIAGAATLVTCLWQVNDEATARLMTEFYQRLHRGMPRGQALREASLRVRKRYPHPYYWAPFVLLGEDGPLLLPTTASPPPQ